MVEAPLWPLYENQPERLILRGDLAEVVVWSADLARDVTGDYWGHEVGRDVVSALLADFEILEPPNGVNGAFLADTDFYQGINAIRVLRRRADDRLFGFKYWDTAGNDSWESDLGSNADKHPGTALPEPDTNVPGFDWDRDWPPETFVFQPAEPYVITGYRIVGDSEQPEDGNE